MNLVVSRLMSSSSERTDLKSTPATNGTALREAATGEVVAFANYWLVADELHILNIAVHPRQRRSGHATRLLAHMVEVARQGTCRCVTLEVRRSNAVAQQLYRRFAFRAVGVRPNYYAEDQEDAIVMLLEMS